MANPDKLQNRLYFQYGKTWVVYFMFLFFLFTSCEWQKVDETDYFKIRVVDGETGRV